MMHIIEQRHSEQVRHVLCIATTIERCKTEGMVDVFQVVKALRMQKPGAVCNVVSNITHESLYFSDAVQYDI